MPEGREHPEVGIVVAAHRVWYWLDTMQAIAAALHDDGKALMSESVWRVCGEMADLSMPDGAV